MLYKYTFDRSVYVEIMHVKTCVSFISYAHDLYRVGDAYVREGRCRQSLNQVLAFFSRLPSLSCPVAHDAKRRTSSSLLFMHPDHPAWAN